MNEIKHKSWIVWLWPFVKCQFNAIWILPKRASFNHSIRDNIDVFFVGDENGELEAEAAKAVVKL